MKRRLWIGLAVLLQAFCAGGASVVRADPNALPRTVNADLSGSGRPSHVSVTASMKPDTVAGFSLSVDLAHALVTLDKEAGMNELLGLRVVQIDEASKQRQIIVVLNGDNDRKESYIFSYDGRQIKNFGLVESWLDVPGNGSVYGKTWRGFWDQNDKYMVNLRTHSIVPVTQPLYYIGASCTDTRSFDILQDHARGKPIVAAVAPNSKIEVVVYWEGTIAPSMNDSDPGWYLIKTQTGLCGWAQLKTFQDKQQGLPFAD